MAFDYVIMHICHTSSVSNICDGWFLGLAVRVRAGIMAIAAYAGAS